MASRTRTPICSHALEKRSRQINPAIDRTIGLRCAAGIRKEDSVRNKRQLLPAHGGNSDQDGGRHKKSAEDAAPVWTSQLQCLRKNLRKGKPELSGRENAHENTPFQ